MTMAFLCNRRHFLGAAVAASLGTARADDAPKRKMTLDLVAGMIGVNMTFPEQLALAHKHGFESVGPDAGHLGKFSDKQLNDLKAEMKAKKLVFGSAGLPVEFRTSEEAFKAGMKELPAFAKALQRAGATRVNTW